MQTATPSQPLSTAPGLDRRRREARRFAALREQFTAALPDADAATSALIESVVGLSLRIEGLNREQRRGEAVDPDQLMKLINTQGRLLRQLGLTNSLEPRNPQRRLSLTSRSLESEVARRAVVEGGGFGELGSYVESQREKLAALAIKYRFPIEIADDAAGGRLCAGDLFAADEAGDTARVRKLIRRAQEQYEQVRRLACHDRRADEGGCRQRHKQGELKAMHKMLLADKVRPADDNPRDDADETLARPGLR